MRLKGRSNTESRLSRMASEQAFVNKEKVGC